MPWTHGTYDRTGRTAYRCATVAGAQIVRRSVDRDACRPHVGYNPHPQVGVSCIQKGRATDTHHAAQGKFGPLVPRYGWGHRGGSTPVSGMERTIFLHVHPANACRRRDATAPRHLTHAGTTPSIPARSPPVMHAEKHAAEDHNHYNEQYRPNHPSVSLSLIVNTYLSKPVSFPYQMLTRAVPRTYPYIRIPHPYRGAIGVPSRLRGGQGRGIFALYNTLPCHLLI